MSCDPTFEWCNQLQADATDAPDAADAADATNTTGNATGPAGPAGPGGKGGKPKGPPKALVTKVAIKFVNAMWATMFARVLSVGLQMLQRSTKQYAVQTTTIKGYMDASTVYDSYKYSGYMLVSWGLYGWTVFLLKRFMKGSDLVKKLSLIAAQGNGVVGLALLGMSIWRTTGRDNCSTTVSWQCWYDSSPTTEQSWSNGQYAQQSRTAYLLAFQMMWLSKTTTKWLTADLKFKKAEEKKEAAAKDAKAADDAADGDADADADADADGDAAGDADADADDTTDADADAAESRLMKALEFAAWGL